MIRWSGLLSEVALLTRDWSSSMKSVGDSRRMLFAGFMVLGILAVVGTLAYVLRNRNQLNQPHLAQDDANSEQALAGGKESPAQPPAYRVDSGLSGFSLKQQSIGQEGSDEQLKQLTHIGLPGSAQFPPISEHSGPAAASVIEAIREKKYPERLSPVFAPAPFDPEKYAADPEAYVGVHEPGRAYQSAQPASGVPPLEAASSQLQTLKAGESVRLAVKTLPGMPATFTSFDNGVFENGLISQTAVADAQGLATVTFRSSQGQRGEVNVLSASPVASERVHFVIFVEPALGQ